MPSPAIEHCIHNSVTNPLRCLCYSQACLPLSYAAQIPITRYPDLANVRVSLSNVDQAVRKCSACVFVSVCLCLYLYMGDQVCCVCEKECTREWYLLVQSNIHRESTAQVKGAAEVTVTVVATHELKAGDLLLRFKAEAAQDEPRHGNNDDWYVYIHIISYNFI